MSNRTGQTNIYLFIYKAQSYIVRYTWSIQYSNSLSYAVIGIIPSSLYCWNNKTDARLRTTMWRVIEICIDHTHSNN